ncbi:hypothetical protein BDZ89DRAFT_1138146 [Hymenopellis radicata]|nr:hypothetical protein BDZ89DRAFT_1138146 [Hymenopellis radicata]
MAGWTSLASQFPNCSVIQLSSARMEQRLAHQTQISNFFRVPTFLPNTDRRLKLAVASIRGPYETAAAAFVGPISLNSALSALDGLFTEILAINGDLKPLDRSVDPHSNNGLAMFAFHLRAFIACLLSEIGLDPFHKACHVHNILQPLCVITNRGVDIAYPALPAGHALFRSDPKGKAAVSVNRFVPYTALVNFGFESAKANVSAVLIDETLEAVGDKLVGDIDMDNVLGLIKSLTKVVIDQKDRALSSSYWADKPNKANAPVRSKAADTLGAPSESNEPAPKRKASQQELSRRAKKMAKASHILVEPVVLDQFTQAVSCTDSFRHAMQQVHRSLERLNDFNDSLSTYLGEDALRQAELQYRWTRGI